MMSSLMDWAREARVGLAEAVLADAKTDAQLAAILAEAEVGGHRLLLTRLEATRAAQHPQLDYDPLSRTAILGAAAPLAPAPARIAIVTGGMGDLPAATEAARTLAFAGHGAAMLADLGVAGLWRLLDRIEAIRRAEIVIVAAGMEGAIFSVLAGLIAAPLIALPTSVGQGVAAHGRVALGAALGSCAPGLVTVNIDNGFGAAQAALRMLHAIDRRQG